MRKLTYRHDLNGLNTNYRDIQIDLSYFIEINRCGPKKPTSPTKEAL